MSDLLYERCFVYIGLMIQKLQGIIAFFGKIKNKTGFYATSILLNVLESYLYLLREV